MAAGVGAVVICLRPDANGGVPQRAGDTVRMRACLHSHRNRRDPPGYARSGPHSFSSTLGHPVARLRHACAFTHRELDRTPLGGDRAQTSRLCGTGWRGLPSLGIPAGARALDGGAWGEPGVPFAEQHEELRAQHEALQLPDGAVRVV